jgi:DNA-binding beta-propeller fold protein YncE
MPPEGFEQRLHFYLDERSMHAGSPASVERTVATVFDGGRRSAPVRTRRLFVAVAIAVIAALVVATPITVFLLNRTTHSTPAPVIEPHPSPTAEHSVQLSGSPGSPAVNPGTHTLYVPIQCPTSACNSSSDFVDLVNTATCNAEVGSGCQVVTQARVDVSPQAVAIDQATDTIYVASWDNTEASVAVLDGARCNATDTRGCAAVAQVDVGGVAAAFNPRTRTLYVAEPGGGIYVINGATCNAVITTGCGGSHPILTDNYGPNALDIDLASDTIYAVNEVSGDGNTVSVLDGATCNGTDTSGCTAAAPTVKVGNNSWWASVDQATGTVYVSSYDDGTVSVIDGARCNATNTSGCGAQPRVIPIGSGPTAIAVDDQLHTAFVVSQNDDALSEINTETCNGVATSTCAQLPPSERAGSDEGSAFNAFPNSVTLVPQTDTAYLVSAAGTNVLAVVSVSGCNATNTSACRATAPSVPAHEFEASIDAATDTIYASNYALPEIDVLNGATCHVADLSGCAPVAEIPMPDPMSEMGAIDDATHTLYVGESFGTQVAVINIATCTATDTAGCGGPSSAIKVGESPGSPVLNTTTRTLYVPYGTEANEVAVLDAATCNAEVTSGCDQRPGIVDVGLGTDSLGVSVKTDTIYAPSAGIPLATGTTMSVINGATCNGTDHSGCALVAATVNLGGGPTGVAVDDATNTVYVTENQGGYAPGTVAIINGATCNGHTTAGCSEGFPSATVGRGPRQVVADTSTDAIYIVEHGGLGVSVINGANCNAGNTSGCAEATSEQAIAAQPNAIALNQDTNTVYVMTFLVSASVSIFGARG